MKTKAAVLLEAGKPFEIMEPSSTDRAKARS